MNYRIAATLVSFVVIPAYLFAPANADSISPGIRDSGRSYSDELPNTEWYGTGIGGIATEASVLRFEAEQECPQWDYSHGESWNLQGLCQLMLFHPISHKIFFAGVLGSAVSGSPQPCQALQI